MDGILIIDKPAGITSHDVVSRVRRILKTRRVGHTGTLDPFATGVLVLLIGKATRLARFLDKDKKEYLADVQFGSETDTGDRTGMRISDCGLRDAELSQQLLTVDWDGILDRFRGEITQTPPMYSAKKIAGKKLYELARAGVEVERAPIHIRIHELELLEDQSHVPRSARCIRVVCSAGTYVRTLAEDIGKSIGTGAHLLALRRTAAGKFDLSQSVTLDALQELREPAEALHPVDVAVSHLPEFTVPEERVEKTQSGLSTRAELDHLEDGEYVQMITNGGTVIAVGAYDANEKSVRPKVVLI